MHVVFVIKTIEGKTKSFRVPNVKSNPKAIDIKAVAKSFADSNMFNPKAGALTGPKKATLIDAKEKEFNVVSAS
jgi:hypothetical protein